MNDLTEEDLKQAIKEIGNYKEEITYKEPTQIWALGRTWKIPKELKVLQEAINEQEKK